MIQSIGSVVWHEFYPEGIGKDMPATREVTAHSGGKGRYSLQAFTVAGLPPLTSSQEMFFILHENADGMDLHRATPASEDSEAMHMLLSLLSKGLLY